MTSTNQIMFILVHQNQDGDYWTIPVRSKRFFKSETELLNEVQRDLYNRIEKFALETSILSKYEKTKETFHKSVTELIGLTIRCYGMGNELVYEKPLQLDNMILKSIEKCGPEWFGLHPLFSISQSNENPAHFGFIYLGDFTRDFRLKLSQCVNILGSQCVDLVDFRNDKLPFASESIEELMMLRMSSDLIKEITLTTREEEQEKLKSLLEIMSV